MACFLVPGCEAAVVTAATKLMEKKEANLKDVHVSFDGENVECAHKIPFARKMKWLSNLQWGGAALLMFEHLWHGEVAPFAPFLTAMSNQAAAAEMFHEMATVGVGMAALTTAVWAGMVAVSNMMEKKVEVEETVTE